MTRCGVIAFTGKWGTCDGRLHIKWPLARALQLGHKVHALLLALFGNNQDRYYPQTIFNYHLLIPGLAPHRRDLCDGGRESAAH